MAALSAPTAHAQSLTITYTLGAFSYTQSPNPGSSFSLSTRTQTLALNPGINDITNAQGMTFNANFHTAYSDNIGTAGRSMTINGVTGTVSQPFEITTATTTDADGNIIANDALSLMPGSTTTFNLGFQGTVTFTPHAYGDFGEQQGTYTNNTPQQVCLHACCRAGAVFVCRTWLGRIGPWRIGPWRIDPACPQAHIFLPLSRPLSSHHTPRPRWQPQNCECGRVCVCLWASHRVGHP